MKTSSPSTAALLAVIAIATASCASKDLYATGQNWQRQECIKIPDLAQRDRCMASAARSYEDYQRETAAARSGK